MRTRRSRGVKQTRKGGDARKNFERYKSNWSSQEKYREYNQKMYYPTSFEKLRGFKPSYRVDLETENTYIFQRHGFSCANLLKAKKDKFHFRVADPSLTAYGILTLLRNNEKPPEFDGRVFTSSLIRTVQTAILEYGMHGNLELIMSPYIKEKNGMIADLANFPLPFDQQMAHMEQFMKILKGINSDVARAIVTKQHTIVFKDQRYTLSSYELPPMVTVPSKPSKSVEILHQEMFGKPPNTSEPEKRFYEYPIPEDPDEREDYSYVTRVKIEVGDTIPAVREPTITKYAFIPTVLSIPEANYSKYYGPEGFIYFDYWVKRNYPDVKFVFVVSHSNFMQKVIQEYCEVPLVTTIFDENAWKLSIRPKPPSDTVKHSNYIFELYHGIPKPSPDELSLMSLRDEPSCRTAVVEVNNEEDVEDMLRQTEVANHGSNPTFKPVAPSLNSTFKPVTPGLNPLDPERNSLFLTEAPPEVPIQSRDVTLETKFDITRSFTELVYMLSNPGIAQGLSLLIDSPKELKTKVLQFVYSNPSVIDTPSSFFSRFKRSTPSVPLYLFQNHYLAFILMYSPFYNALVQRLESGSDILATITSHPSSVIRFFKQLRTLIDTDSELKQVLVSIFAVNANKHYSFEAPPKVYAFTLLDLLLYEMLPMTKEKMKVMYPLFIHLVRKGARFSKTIYSENIVATEVIPRKMPISELKTLDEIEQIDLEQQWDDAKRRLDPTNEVSKLSEQFRLAKQRLQDVNRKVNRRSNTQMQEQLEKQSVILDEMYDIKRRYREESTRLDPTQELSRLKIAYRETINENVFDYLDGSFAEYIPSYDLELKKLHKELLKKIKAPESLLTIPKSVPVGGSKGTSWKRSSLRQSSVKGGRYRASLYKGKRRTRANRS